MSLNQLTLVNTKPWLNVRANNLKIDGNLSVQAGTPEYALAYHGPNDVRFSPLDNIQLIGSDEFYIQPVTNSSPSRLLFSNGVLSSNNFELDIDNNLKCLSSGYYLILTKVVEASGSNTSRPRPILAINNVERINSGMHIPLCTPQPFQTYSGLQSFNIYQLVADDIIKLNLAIQPAGTISLMNNASASNIILVKMS